MSSGIPLLCPQSVYLWASRRSDVQHSIQHSGSLLGYDKALLSIILPRLRSLSELIMKFAARYLPSPFPTLFFLLLSLSLVVASVRAQVDVLTQRYDNARSGTNLRETILKPSNVNPKSFGKLFSRDVDGEIYAQPLVIAKLPMPGRGVRSVVFVATEHNSVYAFDAVDPDANAPFWQVQLGPPVPVGDVGQACGTYSDFSKEIGITGTPVIDASTRTLYVVARTKTSAGKYLQRLHALDILTGKDRPGSPRLIQATVPGTGEGSVKGKLSFDPKIHNQRPALLLHDGVVYITWAAHCDTGPYHGWMMGYNARTLQQTTVFCTTPNGEGAGIWQSGVGPVVDETGHIYVINGNGSVDTDQPNGNGPKTEFGSSFLKFGLKAGKLSVVDWFTPYNYTSLNDADLDTGSTSVILVPGTPLLIAGSKAGMMYVLNRDKMGGFNMFADQQIVQRFPASSGFMYGTPVYWHREGSRPWIYSWGVDDRLKAFQAGDTQINPVPISQSLESISSPRPGGFLSLSANGHDPQSGILWALQPVENANQKLSAGILRAFNASNLSQELWNSNAAGSRDDIGLFAKFCIPTVANGRVYMASFSHQLHVYGLNPRPQAMPPIIASRSETVQDFVSIDTEQTEGTIRYTLDGSNPTALSPRYRTPFKLEQPADVKARVFAPNLLPSATVAARITDPGVIGTGNGLLGSYYTNTALSGTAIQQVDAGINNQPPPPGIPRDNWSARWEGEIQASHTGTFTFHTHADDGIRLWVDGKMLINQWLIRGSTEDTATIELEAGKKYALKVEYYQAVAGLDYRLFWTPPHGFKTIVPRSQLYAAIDLGNVGNGTGLLGNYFKNVQLSGAPIERLDAQISTQDPPQGIGEGANKEKWSARWNGQVQATQTGEFTFHTIADDGMRLWVNGQKLVDDWNVHGSQENSGTIRLEAGKKYPILLEYFQGANGFDFNLLWTPPGLFKMIIPQSQLYSGNQSVAVIGQGQGLAASYFNNEELSGDSIDRVDAQINNQERPDGVPEDHWSARWTGQIQATHSGTFLFHTFADDGMRLWVNNQLLIDKWRVLTPQDEKEFTATITLEAGKKYPIIVEYLQATNARDYILSWTPPGLSKTPVPQSQLYPESDPGVVGTGTGLLAQYYPNKELNGQFARRLDAGVNNQPPPQGIGKDNWSARWSGQVQATHSGEFTFSTFSDDGVRLWVNDQLLIDDWNVHGTKENQGKITLEAGKKYSIVLEYFQGDNGLDYRLLWSNPQQPKMLIPTSQLYPNPSQ